LRTPLAPQILADAALRLYGAWRHYARHHSSPIAVHASVQVVRAFVRLRDILVTHKDLARKLHEMEHQAIDSPATAPAKEENRFLKSGFVMAT